MNVNRGSALQTATTHLNCPNQSGTNGKRYCQPRCGHRMGTESSRHFVLQQTVHSLGKQLVDHCHGH